MLKICERKTNTWKKSTEIVKGGGAECANQY